LRDVKTLAKAGSVLHLVVSDDESSADCRRGVCNHTYAVGSPGYRMEEVLFETESRQSRTDIARYLRTVADKLETADPITLSSGGDSVTLDVPDRPTFEVKAEREGTDPNAELSVEFELEWNEGGGDGDLSIE
jgi:amphi-Trp domain-containing protein